MRVTKYKDLHLNGMMAFTKMWKRFPSPEAIGKSDRAIERQWRDQFLNAQKVEKQRMVGQPAW
jgi:hypothetical protein